MWLIRLAGSAVLVWALAQTGWTPALVMVTVGLLLIAYWLSPWYGGISRKEHDVRALPSDQRRLIIYWRPADIFSTRLRGGLGKHGKRFMWVNVWQDREAEERATSLGDGVYPVVLVDDETYINPDPRKVIALL